ncbi:hypothetical protein L2734_19205 [Parashewanella spongiae]|uniref:hypothetical protein n=1 Tax=Parashewanella spongiae TaxID=342950 RepID=UPI00200C7D9E|nr:hypothetical protein [Parashewanella spongiae]MCL1080255.1 hypothetical protein [Parashewanella spongiae]
METTPHKKHSQEHSPCIDDLDSYLAQFRYKMKRRECDSLSTSSLSSNSTISSLKTSPVHLPQIQTASTEKPQSPFLKPIIHSVFHGRSKFGVTSILPSIRERLLPYYVKPEHQHLFRHRS